MIKKTYFSFRKYNSSYFRIIKQTSNLKKELFYRINLFDLTNRIKLHFIFVLVLGVGISVSSAQNRGFDQNITDGDIPSDSLITETDSIDVGIKLHSTVFSFNNIFDTIPFVDSLLTKDFPYFNPLDASDLPLVDKGYIGSGSMPITGYKFKPGFDLGYHQYDFYKKNIDSYHWHVNNAPFSSLFFSPGSNVNEFWTQAKFSKNYKDATLDIDYNRINNIGKYMGQSNKHTDLNMGIWLGGYDSKFNTFLNLIAEVHEEEDNGGITNDSLLDQSSYSIRTTVPVNLSDAVTRLENLNLMISEYYRLFDTISVFGFKPYLTGKFGLTKGFYKFYDKSVSSDTSIYKSLMVDDSGLRNYITFNSILSNVGVMIVNPSGSYIKAGIDYQYWKYNQEPLGDIKINQFQLFSNGNIFFAKGLDLNWDSKFFFGKYIGDLDVKLDISFSKSIFILKTGVKLGNFSPPLIMNQLYLTGIKVYENDFSKINVSGFNASVSVEKIGLSVTLNSDLTRNYIYFSDDLIPVQSEDLLTFYSLNIRENIGIWLFHLDTDMFLFHGSSDILPLPKYTLKSKFYINSKLFKKKLKINTGFEVNYWGKYYNNGFNPAIGNFFVQNSEQLDNYVRLDYFLSAKINSFLFFLRFNNILNPLSDEKFNINRIPYKVLDHPQSDLFWRLGVKWTLLN